MSNIHADLIKNATDMQSQLLQFSHELSKLSLKSLDAQSNFKMTVYNDMFTYDAETDTTTVSFKLGETNTTVEISRSGVPSDPSGSLGEPKNTVAKAMAVVAMNLRGVGVGGADIQEIFKNGITPTSLAAVESQLKGHHDAVMQLSLESLSRVTTILQKIAQKLSN